MVAVYVFDIHLYGGALIYTLKGKDWTKGHIAYYHLWKWID